MVCLLIMSVSLITTIATDPDYDIERVNEMIDTVPNNDLPLYIYEYEVFLLPTSIKKLLQDLTNWPPTGSFVMLLLSSLL